jgi:hypothetical protein
MNDLIITRSASCYHDQSYFYSLNSYWYVHIVEHWFEIKNEDQTIDPCNPTDMWQKPYAEQKNIYYIILFILIFKIGKTNLIEIRCLDE